MQYKPYKKRLGDGFHEHEINKGKAMEITPLNKWIPNLKKPLVIAGPCSAETREQCLSIAKEIVQNEDVRIFRAGIWKPRTRPGSFEGVGEEGLSWLDEVKKETGLLTSCEVATAKHAELALKSGIDILWIGARTSANPFAVQEIADFLKGTKVPVLIKNPINADLALWIGAIERIASAGITKLGAIHRGFSTHEQTMYRNRPLWRIPIELKSRLPGLPVICDPSHIAGKRDLIQKVSQKAMDVDFDGLMIETHCDPDAAWSDAKQQVTPNSLKEILSTISVRTEYSHDRNFGQELDDLRDKIDRIDNDLLEGLQERMKIVDSIGKAKIKSNITALQIHRMDELMNKRMQIAEALGLNPQYIKEIYDVIHDHSVKVQTEMMNETKTNKED